VLPHRALAFSITPAAGRVAANAVLDLSVWTAALNPATTSDSTCQGCGQPPHCWCWFCWEGPFDHRCECPRCLANLREKLAEHRHHWNEVFRQEERAHRRTGRRGCKATVGTRYVLVDPPVPEGSGS
jgi:hypothetical protein